MIINWSGERTIIANDAKALKECISCPNVNGCANELKEGQIFCISLYTKFTDNAQVKERLESLLEGEN